MRFSKALKKLRHGEAIARDEWPDGCYLKIENDKENWSLYHPTIYFEPADENQSHGIWTPHQADILANDWFVLPVGDDTKDGLESIREQIAKTFRDAYNNGEISNY